MTIGVIILCIHAVCSERERERETERDRERERENKSQALCVILSEQFMLLPMVF